MKVSSIIADIEYIQPAGTIDKYKYGVRMQHASNLDSDNVIHQSSQVIQQDLSKLKGELSKPQSNTMKLPQVETVGKTSS